MMEYCAQWLLEYLRRAGRANVKQVRLDAKKMGWTRGELKAARREIGVQVVHDQTSDEWYWYV